MTESLIDAEKLTGITLAKGGHDSPEQGLCLMEALSFVRGIPHTDRPPCVSSLLGEMGRSLNDVLPDDLRQQLIPVIPALPTTAGDGHDEMRSYMALDWLIRTWLPAWLDLVPATREDARKLRELGRIVDLVAAERAGPVVRASRKNAAAAGAAARDAARAAADVSPCSAAAQHRVTRTAAPCATKAIRCSTSGPTARTSALPYSHGWT